MWVVEGGLSSVGDRRWRVVSHVGGRGWRVVSHVGDLSGEIAE